MLHSASDGGSLTCARLCVLAGGCPSTCRDIVCGRPSEIREFSGTLVKMGQEKGVPMPGACVIRMDVSCVRVLCCSALRCG